MLKSSLLFKKTQTLQVNNSRIPRTKTAKFSEYYFYLNKNIYGDFKICISVSLSKAAPKSSSLFKYVASVCLSMYDLLLLSGIKGKGIPIVKDFI